MCLYVFRSRHWHETGSWNPYSIISSKTRNYLFYIVSIMGADVLAMQGACQWQGTGIGIHQEQFHGGIFTPHQVAGLAYSLIHFTIFLNSVVSLLSYDILGYYIQHDSGHNIICFLITVQSYGVCKGSSTIWPVGLISLFAHYTTSLSSLCRRI